ncbi:hypothetical protein BTJ40_19840 [Microbulbifer sp. A4B17]|uniref:hypothetical protein n=1 Tax=Microbulbifer sp. A4B17 TaxID=359370 RepID=UPI000D52D58A|nr:hypothetical protein [Microbulbifer sp. A4B17]AWF82889.1 hypothetical protein BTJ40_19840 [Microbulbifer sp. A4B17]
MTNTGYSVVNSYSPSGNLDIQILLLFVAGRKFQLSFKGKTGTFTCNLGVEKFMKIKSRNFWIVILVSLFLISCGDSSSSGGDKGLTWDESDWDSNNWE